MDAIPETTEKKYMLILFNDSKFGNAGEFQHFISVFT